MTDRMVIQVIQSQLDDIVRLRTEDNTLYGKDKELSNHAEVLMIAVKDIKNLNGASDEEKKTTSWISKKFKDLLDSLRIEFNNNNNKLLDFLFKEFNIPVWKYRQDSNILCLKVEGVLVLF
jgi:hypothetical protein